MRKQFDSADDSDHACTNPYRHRAAPEPYFAFFFGDQYHVSVLRVNRMPRLPGRRLDEGNQ